MRWLYVNHSGDEHDGDIGELNEDALLDLLCGSCRVVFPDGSSVDLSPVPMEGEG